MKFLLILLSVTLINKDCSNKVEQENTSIEYHSSSRGTYLQIIVKNQTISVNRKRQGNYIVKECTKDAWNNIIKAYQKIKIEKLPSFEIPSKDHQFDGAALARFTINSNGKTYESGTFDHGNPPEEIATLVKEILSLAENIE